MDRLDEIRERQEDVRATIRRQEDYPHVAELGWYVEDIPCLLERIDELERENEELHEDNKQLREANKELTNTLRFIDSNSP